MKVHWQVGDEYNKSSKDRCIEQYPTFLFLSIKAHI